MVSSMAPSDSEAMQPDITKKATDDGTIDADYTFGRPAKTYVSSLEYLRLLLVKARVHPSNPPDELGPGPTLFKPC